MLLHGDCLEKLKEIPENSIDSIVTDPPYGLSFMGKKWDYDVPSVEIWKECLRVLKPGGYLLSFAGTRTQHRMACNIEDAGFEIRDMIAWVYGSGFPKSLNIGKAVDKLQGNEREVVGKKVDISTGRPMSVKQAKAGNGKNINEGWDRPWRADDQHCEDMTLLTKGTSEWEGWGTALKPALEPITVARKPLSENTVAENVLKWGTGGIAIDACRIEGTTKHNNANGVFAHSGTGNEQPEQIMKNYTKTFESNKGRFPANLIHDGSDEVLSLFPETKSGKVGVRTSDGFNSNAYGKGMGIKAGQDNGEYGDSGSAARFFKTCPPDGCGCYRGTDIICSKHQGIGAGCELIQNNLVQNNRFFYCAKASKSERNIGCEELPKKAMTELDKIGGEQSNFKTGSGNERDIYNQNNHPTVKPLALMKYLVKLVTPKGTVLDPFMGSGTTGMACKELGFDFIGIEREEDYLKIAEARINAFI